MKYVIFKHRQLFMPVLLPEHVTHSMVTLAESKPVSAGFYHIAGGRVVVSSRQSISLQLGPLPRDAALIAQALLDSGTASFLVDEPDEKCRSRKRK